MQLHIACALKGAAFGAAFICGTVGIAQEALIANDTAQLDVMAGPDVAPTIEDRKIDYRVVNLRAADFFALLAQDVGLRVDISGKVTGRLRNVRISGTTADVLDQISNMLSLDWFEFNGVIYISSREQATTRIIRLGDLTADDTYDALEESGLKLARYPIQVASEGTALAISGPPKMLALAEAVIESIPPAPIAARNVASPKTVIERRGIQTTTVIVN